MTPRNRLRQSLVALAAAALCFTVTVDVSPLPGRSASVSLEARAQALDLVKEAWSKFRSQVLGKVVDLIKAPVAKAEAALKKLIDGAVAQLQKVFESDVILPALLWALPKVFPGSQKILDYVRQALGSIDRLTQSARNYSAAVDAFIQKNPVKMKEAMAKVNESGSLFDKLDVAQVIDLVLRAAKEKAPAFIKAKTLELLNKAFSAVEAPVQAGKAAATAALASVPVLGPSSRAPRTSSLPRG